MEDPRVTEEIQRYLAQPADERDAEAGAVLLLRVSCNKVRHRMMAARGFKPYQETIDKALGGILDYRLAKVTHEQVTAMKAEADNRLEPEGKEEERVRNGRREDHDSLPPEIQGMYAETLDLLRRERELHLQVRRLSLADKPCAESEVYPFVKELIKLDDRRLKLWEQYDHYTDRPK